MSNYDYMFKCIVIGDVAVGKTSINNHFVEGRFDPEHHATLGVEYSAKTLQVAGLDVKMQIWDTSGQQSFRSITRSYYRSAMIALLVYDITRRDTFDNLLKWIAEVKNYSHDKLEVLLVGNKCDLKEQRAVSVEEGQKLAREQGFQFFETSAKKGQNVEISFFKAAERVVKRINSKDIDLTKDTASNYGIKVGKKKPGMSQPSPVLKTDPKDTQTQNKGCC